MTHSRRRQRFLLRLTKLSRKSRIGIMVAALMVAVAAFTPMAVAGAESTDEVSTQAVSHRVPFPCGQTWSGQTRTNHSPLKSIDFNRANDSGDKVSASAAGTVVHRGSMAGTSYGNLVVIRHSNGTASYYAHLSGFNVSNGAKVKVGQVIGYVGGTGHPKTPGGFGAHLHYEQRTSYGGSAVNIKFNSGNVSYYGTKNYTVKCGSSNPYSPKEVCGSNFSVINQKSLGNGTVYLMYNSKTKANCVVTLKSTNLGKATATMAYLEVKGKKRVTDSGKFSYYAGPVKQKAAKTCVKWGGKIGNKSFSSGWGHCG